MSTPLGSATIRTYQRFDGHPAALRRLEITFDGVNRTAEISQQAEGWEPTDWQQKKIDHALASLRNDNIKMALHVLLEAFTEVRITL